VIKLGKILTIVVIALIALVIGAIAYMVATYKPSPPKYTVSEVTTILKSYDITTVEVTDYDHHTGFSQGPIFIKFDEPKDFAKFCLSKNVTTVMHWQGNMYYDCSSPDQFFFIEGETIYRFVIQ
jgi:hypothetical protein